MASETIVLILGIASSISLIISALSVHRMRLLVFGLITSALVVAQMLIIGSALSAVLICFIGVFRTIAMLIAEKKYPKLNNWMLLTMFIAVYVSAFLFTNDMQTVQWYNYLPVVGSILATIGIFILDMAWTKSLYVAAGILWAGFYLSVGMNTQLIGEVVTIAANASALALILRSRKLGIRDEDIRDVDDQIIDALTGSIPVITGAIKTATSSIQLPAKTRPIPVVLNKD